ncbi:MULTISPECIES: hypothetical protein [Phenylobacterium]|uniref:DUF2214 domain-containing protein n=1 Tax=Phenylobacterium koreense TaxID=266125 RepID=A0ABV2EKC1_9CAUL
METIFGLAEALEGSAFGGWARGSSLAYPVANLVHLLGLVMLVGAIGVLDLRLAGLWRSLPLPELSRALTPIGVAGLLVMLPSGFVMFAADAGSLIGSPVFQAKLAVIALGIANALAFRVLWRGDEPAGLGRLMVIGSVGAWLMVAALGRLIAYT